MEDLPDSAYTTTTKLGLTRDSDEEFPKWNSNGMGNGDGEEPVGKLKFGI